MKFLDSRWPLTISALLLVTSSKFRQISADPEVPVKLTVSPSRYVQPGQVVNFSCSSNASTEVLWTLSFELFYEGRSLNAVWEPQQDVFTVATGGDYFRLHEPVVNLDGGILRRARKNNFVTISLEMIAEASMDGGDTICTVFPYENAGGVVRKAIKLEALVEPFLLRFFLIDDSKISRNVNTSQVFLTKDVNETTVRCDMKTGLPDSQLHLQAENRSSRVDCGLGPSCRGQLSVPFSCNRLISTVLCSASSSEIQSGAKKFGRKLRLNRIPRVDASLKLSSPHQFTIFKGDNVLCSVDSIFCPSLNFRVVNMMSSEEIVVEVSSHMNRSAVLKIPKVAAGNYNITCTATFMDGSSSTSAIYTISDSMTLYVILPGSRSFKFFIDHTANMSSLVTKLKASCVLLDSNRRSVGGLGCRDAPQNWPRRSLSEVEIVPGAVLIVHALMPHRLSIWKHDKLLEIDFCHHINIGRFENWTEVRPKLEILGKCRFAINQPLLAWQGGFWYQNQNRLSQAVKMEAPGDSEWFHFDLKSEEKVQTALATHTFLNFVVDGWGTLFKPDFIVEMEVSNEIQVFNVTHDKQALQALCHPKAAIIFPVFQFRRLNGTTMTGMVQVRPSAGKQQWLDLLTGKVYKFRRSINKGRMKTIMKKRGAVNFERGILVLKDGDLLPKFKIPNDKTLLFHTRHGFTVGEKQGRVQILSNSADPLQCQWIASREMTELDRKVTQAMRRVG